jgi:hypothetical protein
LHEIAVRIAFADYRPAAAKFARHAEVAKRATVRRRASVDCDFCSNEGHGAAHLATRRNRRELHVALNERLHRFDGRAGASLRHEACDIFRTPPRVLVEQFRAHGVSHRIVHRLDVEVHLNTPKTEQHWDGDESLPASQLDIVFGHSEPCRRR